MIISEAIAAVLGAVAIALLTAVYRIVRQIADLPERVEAIDAENRRAHGDLWREIKRLQAAVDRGMRR